MSDFHMTRRQLIGTGATIGMVGLLAACGQATMTGGEAAPVDEETSTEAAQPETMEVVNLVYASPESPARQEKEIAIFDDFNAQHSNIQVEVAGQAGGWRGVYEEVHDRPRRRCNLRLRAQRLVDVGPHVPGRRHSRPD